MPELVVKYVGVQFEDKWNEGEFYGPIYNYKTTRPLKEGEIVDVPVFNRRKGILDMSTAKVIQANVDPRTINFPLEELKEII